MSQEVKEAIGLLFPHGAIRRMTESVCWLQEQPDVKGT